MSSSGLGGEDQRDSFVCCKHWTLYLSSTTGYLVTREAIEFSRSWEGLARPSKGSRQGHWARLGMGALSTSAPAVPLLAPVCSLHPNPLPSPGVGPIPCSAVGLRRLGTGAQMQASLDALLTMGLGFLGEGKTGWHAGERADTRKMCPEQRKSHRTGLRGWEISSLMGKRFSVAGKQRQSRGPRLGRHSQALTGSPLVGLGPSLLIPAPQPTLAVLEEVSRSCSSPPREHAGPDRPSAPCPVPGPTLRLCLSWSSRCSRPGCLLGFSQGGFVRPAVCEPLGWTQTRYGHVVPAPAARDSAASRGREPGF